MEKATYRINFYNEYECSKDKCPSTCCRGWRVPIDEETCAKYMQKGGFMGMRLFMSMEYHNGVNSFRHYERGCPFWGKDCLCGIYKELGEEYMPLVCRVFPRRRTNYGFFAEESLYLGCPEAAALFVQHHKDFCYEKVNEVADYDLSTTNDDEEFLEELVKVRAALIDYVSKVEGYDGLAEAFGRILTYAQAAELSCVRGEALPKVEDYLCENDHTTAFIIDGTTTDHMITDGFYHYRLKKNSPVIYEILKHYFELFDPLTGQQATEKIKELEKAFFEKNSDYVDLLRQYYIYYLDYAFLGVFEDYSFKKNLIIGMAHVHMLMLCLALYSDIYGTLSKAQVASVITAYERRGCNNEEIVEEFYRNVVEIM